MDQIEDLLNTSYRSPVVGPLLQLMLDRARERDASHVDHLYPKTLLKKRSIAKALAGSTRPGSELDDWLERVDQLPNLQLLRTSENTSKGGRVPTEWLGSLTAPTRDVIVMGNDLGIPPDSVVAWFDWFELRRARMRDVLAKELGVSAPAPATP
jgi:hypothetical protein